MSAKIRSEHLARPAVVYIRQSTLLQVLEHRQSTERQYDLAQRATRLGWDATQVQVVDEDLAHSGASATARTGFQRLTADVSLGHVGAIFALEVSRFARSSADWYRLLDLCALSDTLIIDDDGVYDPNDFNDRLVLGMKGTMSDAERHVMRLRLQGGKLHKAKKGQLAFPPPTGYVFDDRSVLSFDPDEQVQRAVRLLFERFRLDGTAYAVVRYFHRHQLQFPARVAHKGVPAEIRWRPLTHARTLAILRNPTYAGAYAYGRRQQRRTLADGAVHQHRSALATREQWHALVRDAHPGYITWEQHMDYLTRLDQNRARCARLDRRGAPRNGEALLQGLALCGRCGRRMRPVYRSASQPSYECSDRPNAAGTCWSVPARLIDTKVAETFLAAIAPPELDLSLAVLTEVEHQADSVDRQWRLRLERARYEATRAERQYNAVEPENRVVARTLETRWNDKLRELAEVERAYEETRRTRKLELSADDKRAIMALARDLPKVWHAPTTTPVERKQLVRLLLEDVVLTPLDVPQRATKVRLLWKTGATRDLLVPRPSSADACKTPEVVLTAVRELASHKQNDAQIATALNHRGLTSGRGRAFTRQAVLMIRDGYDIPSGGRPGASKQPVPARDARGRYSIRGLVAKYHVTAHMVRYWIERGVITPERDYTGGPFWIRLTPAVAQRIAAARRAGYGPRNRPGRKNGGRKPLPLRFPDGSYSTRGLVAKYHVTWHIVRHWVDTGVVTPIRNTSDGDYHFILTPAVERRIQAALDRGTGPRAATRPLQRPLAGSKT
jgi:DNA invertase Pin-like site-specific DNA recombinase